VGGRERSARAPAPRSKTSATGPMNAGPKTLVWELDRIFRALLGTEVARSEPPRVPTRDWIFAHHGTELARSEPTGVPTREGGLVVCTSL